MSRCIIASAASWAIAIVLSVTATLPTQAQETAYRFDLGAGLGTSGYLGDANTSNFLKHPGFAAQVSFRYLIDPRWSIRATFLTAGLSGNSADMTNVLPGGAEYRFTSQVYDLGARVEFNFLNYGIGESYRKLSRWSPYIALGAGVTVASSGGTFTAMNLPMGAGVKYKLLQRINLGLEWTMTKVLGDRVDGEVLDDPYMIKSSFIKNTDWYSTIMITISYEIGQRCRNCFYID